MIIPIFIPHEGCPNDCAFCNQRTISQKSVAPSKDETIKTIESHLETMDGKASQIAFFGGSFTGIDKDVQNLYLSVACEYIKKGMVNSIRLSTRPDYIDKETVSRLSFYGVNNIELGAQSMDDEVLFLSKRGHSAKDVEKAAEIITAFPVTLGLQMMTGLPGDSFQKCLYTAKRFKELGAKETRIYPTVVLGGTYLAKMYQDGEYTPQTVEEAVSISAVLYRYFCDNDIEILRIGLADGEELRKGFIAGAYHPSMGELVISRDVRNTLDNLLAGKNGANISLNRKFFSKLTGNKKCNISYFENKGIKLQLKEDNSVDTYKITAIF